MSKRAEMNRTRRWERKVRVDHQARARVEQEMAAMHNAMVDGGSLLLQPVMEMVMQKRNPFVMPTNKETQ